VVRIEGAVVKDWQTQFIATWRSTTNIDLPSAQDPPVVDDSQHGRVALANGPGKNQILRHAIANMKKSSQIVWIATPYFVITRKLRHALLKAAFRGIDVRLLLPGDITDHLWLTQAARRFYTRLLKNKVHIYEYQPRFIHAKLILCDHWVSIGSSNLDRWNHFWNLDANQEILDPQFAVQVRDLFEGDFQLSKKILLDTWRQRPWRQRIEEWWSSYKIHFIQWLTFFATRRRKKNGLE
jgi:phosphatidylserine/phosphatidylglycerophosphate/cardiolipin synthase-like enzyme